MNINSLISSKPDLENLLGSTSVKTLVNFSNNKIVRLVGVQHIGTPEYFSTILFNLGPMDEVLYEFLDNVYSNRSHVIKNDPYRDLAQRINSHFDEKIIISQQEGMDYVNPPDNWHKADLSYPEVEKLLSEYLPPNTDKGDAVKRFKSVLGFFAEFQKRREQRLLTSFEEFESDDQVEAIGILYGEEHLLQIEQALISKGYERVDSQFLQPIPERYHSKVRMIKLGCN